MKRIHAAVAAIVLIMAGLMTGLSSPAFAGDTNSPPTAGSETATVMEGGKVIVDVLADATDPDGDSLSACGQPTSDKKNGVYADWTSGSLDSTLTIQVGETSLTSTVVKYLVCDPSGAFSKGEVTVTIDPVKHMKVKKVKRGLYVAFNPNPKGWIGVVDYGYHRGHLKEVALKAGEHQRFKAKRGMRWWGEVYLPSTAGWIDDGHGRLK